MEEEEEEDQHWMMHLWINIEYDASNCLGDGNVAWEWIDDAQGS